MLGYGEIEREITIDLGFRQVSQTTANLNKSRTSSKARNMSRSIFDCNLYKSIQATHTHPNGYLR
jgi:hypothetical protein